MSAETATPKKLRIGRMPAGLGPTFKAWLESALRNIARAAGVQLSIDGAESASVGADGSMRFKVSPGIAADAHNWQPRFVSLTKLTMSPGKVNGVYPTIGGTSVNASTRPELTVDASALNYVYLKVPCTLVTSSSFVTSATQGSPIIEAALSLPSSTTSNRYFLLFTWQAGALVSQTSYLSIGWKAEDDQTATSTPVFRDWAAA
jgi:hypothetical protein